VNDFTLCFVPEEEKLREALTSTGKGHFCTRGAAEWEDAHALHYAGTYARGGYNRETTIMGGRHDAARDATPAAIPPECCQAENGEHSVLRQPPAHLGRPEAA
jgi:hypothetical protein